MRDSKPQRDVQQHKSLNAIRIAVNRNKHINERSKQTFPTISFKCHINSLKVCYPFARFVSMSSIYELMTIKLINLRKNNEKVV